MTLAPNALGSELFSFEKKFPASINAPRGISIRMGLGKTYPTYSKHNQLVGYDAYPAMPEGVESENK